MSYIKFIWNNILTNFENQEIFPMLIISVLTMVAILSVYEYVVYRMVLRRALYSKAFNISISIIPFFISMIILCLQSNMIITLGTIGALAIIRFRTAIKDPVDMIFLLWSIFIGISCGCQIYSMAIITSVVVTIILIILNSATITARSHVLVVHTSDVDAQYELEKKIKDHSKKYRIKSRNITGNGVNFVYEILTREADALTKSLSGIDKLDRFSLMEYDSDDII